MKNVKLSEREEIRIEHKIYHGHEGIDVRVWVILKGQSDFTPTHQAFWLSMERADIFFKAFEDEYHAEPAPDETGDDGKEGTETGTSTGAKEPMDQPYPSDPQPSDRQDM